MEDGKFWETDAPFIDHEATALASRGAQMVANFLLIPVFFMAAVVFPILFVMSGDIKLVVAGILFGGFPYSVLLFAIYAFYYQLVSDEILRIHSGSGNVTLTIRTHNGKELNRFEHPIKEIQRVEARETNDSETGNSITVSIKGKNPLGVPWTLDITRFSHELYVQGKPSIDRRRISVIKTAERYGSILGVEVVSWVKLRGILHRDLRDEFDRDWIKQWILTPEREEMNRRILNQKQEDRQKIQ
jgi:hypothetical protein